MFVEEEKLMYKAKLGGDNYEKQDAKQAENKVLKAKFPLFKEVNEEEYYIAPTYDEEPMYEVRHLLNEVVGVNKDDHQLGRTIGGTRNFGNSKARKRAWTLEALMSRT